MPRKEKIYCGDDEDVPKGYKRKGTRQECLRKGYGAALVYSTQADRDKAMASMIAKGPRTLKKEQLQSLALKLGVDIYQRGTTKKKLKEDLVKGIIRALKKSLQ